MAGVNDTIEQIPDRNIENTLCAEARPRQSEPRLYRWVARITKACGTVTFLWANGAFFAAWVLVNLTPLAFDPYPYTFLLFGVSIEAIFLAILILISQNLDAAENERRHHLDLQMNLLSERELTALMRLVVQLAERAGMSEKDTAEVRSFAHDTDPSGVLAQIMHAERRHNLQQPGEKKNASEDASD